MLAVRVFGVSVLLGVEDGVMGVRSGSEGVVCVTGLGFSTCTTVFLQVRVRAMTPPEGLALTDLTL